MTRKFGCIIVLTLAMFFLAPAHNALAEPAPAELRIQRVLQENPTSNVVLMEVKLFKDGGPKPVACERITVTVKSEAGKSTSFITQKSPMLFGHVSETSTYGGGAILAPGTYTVEEVWCEGVIRARGKFAHFTLQSRQTLNLGCLMINYKLGEAHLFSRDPSHGQVVVGDLSPTAVASLKKQVPDTFRKLTKHYMTALALPAASQPKR